MRENRLSLAVRYSWDSGRKTHQSCGMNDNSLALYHLYRPDRYLILFCFFHLHWLYGLCFFFLWDKLKLEKIVWFFFCSGLSQIGSKTSTGICHKSANHRRACAACAWGPSRRSRSSTGSMNNAEPTFSYHFLFPSLPRSLHPTSPPSPHPTVLAHPPTTPPPPHPGVVVKIELQTCELWLWCLHHHDPPHCSLSPDSGVITLIHLGAALSILHGQKQDERLSGQAASSEKSPQVAYRCFISISLLCAS